MVGIKPGGCFCAKFSRLIGNCPQISQRPSQASLCDREGFLMGKLVGHWADQTARRIVERLGDQERYVLASGITPSGTIHIGNFREAITVDFVGRALVSAGQNVRILHSWDDFDTLRKVPKNLPNQEMIAENLKRPISRIPDPRGIAKSFAAFNIDAFEKELADVGVAPEFIYQQEQYASGIYAEPMVHALRNRDKIRNILDKYRSQPLAIDWLPTAIYCEKCDRDIMEYQRYDGEYAYGYKCGSCQHEAVTDIRKTKNLKLNWRSDWPMRWAHEKVDFEPGGKDHSSQGSSYDTAKTIVKEVWNREPPIYLQYDFVSIKGGPGKISSSTGDVVTVAEALSIYSPEIVRFIFARQRPNTDFSLAFDEDVIKTYDEYDRAEALAYSEPDDPENAKWAINRRVIELARPLPMAEAGVPLAQIRPYRPPFRVLANRLQICEGNIERTRARYYQAETKEPYARASFKERAQKTWTWIQTYAPESFRYRINSAKVELPLSAEQQAGISSLRAYIEAQNLADIDAKDINQALYDQVIHKANLEPKEFYKVVYQKLIGREQGPRLPSFLQEIGNERLLELL
jgi:lysyl-tRNA synthetase, class I